MKSREHQFQRQRIWIIGASAGIGASLARELAARGAELVLSARSKEALEELAGEIGAASGHSPAVVPVDLADRETLSEAVRTLSQGEPLDCVINVAALYDPGLVKDLDPDKAEALIRVNLLGTLHVAQLVPSVLRRGGQLALFGSVAGYIGLPKGQIYSATKAGVANLAESLRVELAPTIAVRLISPGFVRTRLTDKNDFEMPAIMEPEDAARAVADGLAGKAFEIHFPKRFTILLKFLRILPYSISLRLTSRMS